MEQFLFLLEVTWSLIVVAWPPGGLICLALVAIALFHYHARRKLAFSWRELLSLLPCLTALILLIWGTVMTHESSRVPGAEWPYYVMLALLLGHVPFCGLVIWQTKGFRLLAVATSLLAGWCAFWAAVVAGMAVSNNWI